jgi:hypothetical protein
MHILQDRGIMRVDGLELIFYPIYKNEEGCGHFSLIVASIKDRFFYIVDSAR